ncbi:MAG: hypothetical protein U0T74_02550 [Chitinophagales bacterium]
MKYSRFLTVFVGIALLLFAACTKEGPEGPAGKDGNMNVQVHTYTVTPSMWYVGPDYLRLTLTDSSITQSVLDSGAIQVSVKGLYTTLWQELPATNYYGSYTLFTNVSPILYGVKITTLTTSNTPMNAPAANCDVKVVSYMAK